MTHDERSNGTNGTNGSRSPIDGVRRRDYLKSAAAAAAVAGGLSGVASAANYETIVADGQTIRVEDGETWSNKLVDFGDRNPILVTATGTDWTIRDVGFRGTMPAETIFGVADTGGGTSRIENVYVGEGDVNQDPRNRGIAIWVDPDHDGHLDVKNVNFQVPGNNGIYGSAPGYNGEGGTIHLDGCYAVDNHHTAFRVAAEGDEIRNCVAVKSGDRQANRGIWIWDPGPVEIHDTDVLTRGVGVALHAGEDDPTTVDCYDFQYEGEIRKSAGSAVTLDEASGTDPDPTPPEGVPRTAEEAAAGVEDDRSFEHVLTVDGGADGDALGYSFATEGILVRSEVGGATVDDDDRVVGAADGGYDGEGSVAGEADAFEFDGRLVCLTADSGDVGVTLDGDVVDPAEYPDDRVYVEGGDEATEYVLTLTGEPTASDYLDAVADPGAVVEETGDGTWEVSATVDGEAHAYVFSGEVEDLTVEPEAATVYVDGAQVFPDEEKSIDELAHLVEFRADDADAPTDYYFEIEDGPMGAVTENGATIDEEFYWISDDGSRAAGRVEAGDRDAYRFDRLLCDISVDGPATPYVNGDESSLGYWPQDCASGDDWKGGFPWQDDPTPTEAPTPTDESTPTDEPTPSDERTGTDEPGATDESTPTDDPTGTDIDSPGFGGVVTLGALATSGAAILRRIRPGEDDE